MFSALFLLNGRVTNECFLNSNNNYKFKLNANFNFEIIAASD